MAIHEVGDKSRQRGNGAEVQVTDRSRGISDCRTGRPPANGMAEGYYEGYSAEYGRQACLDNQTMRQQ